MFPRKFIKLLACIYMCVCIYIRARFCVFVCMCVCVNKNFISNLFYIMTVLNIFHIFV